MFQFRRVDSGTLQSVSKTTSCCAVRLIFVAIIFAPLQLLTCVYGMNFENISTVVKWQYGYAYFRTLAAALIGLLGHIVRHMGCLRYIPDLQ